MLVAVFCLLLISGIVTGQMADLSAIRMYLGLLTSTCLAFIMIEVGLEFSVDQRSLRSYGWDAAVASIAAILPALLWFIYFLVVIQSSWKPALLSGLSSAPTSAGVLFSMMMAAGLSMTWVFRKARTLAVLDDLVTILLLIPLQIMMSGFHWETVGVVVFIITCMFASFRWPNTLHWPTSQRWLLVYSMGLTAMLAWLQHTVHIHLEVLLPAFMGGCLLYRSKVECHCERTLNRTVQGKAKQSFKGLLRHFVPRNDTAIDVVIKGMFMFLVGVSFPKVGLGSIPLKVTILHVLALTVLSNLGKSFTLLCYRREVSFKERLALSVSMFPRGEVGAAVLLISLGFGLGGYENTLAMLSLAFNLVLTGVFMAIVVALLKK